MKHIFRSLKKKSSMDIVLTPWEDERQRKAVNAAEPEGLTRHNHKQLKNNCLFTVIACCFVGSENCKTVLAVI